MAFRDFHYPELLETFGLTAEPVTDLFEGVVSVAPPPGLVESLAATSRLAAIVNTEKARSEGMIAPVLFALWWRYHARIGLYSGAEFDADPDANLTGYCDFLISRSPQQPYVTPPAVVIFEAKKENINDGLGQCIAGMVGAQRFNRRHNALADPIYGCVTTGTAWKFLQLSGTTVTIDLTEYTLPQVDHILGILVYMVGPIPQPAAA
ncbi:MAG: hypothetical protein L0241_08745 [Planctomycetia bacterium]|nr:hypothetical protein [Planctomycetia bacterium]